MNMLYKACPKPLSVSYKGRIAEQKLSVAPGDNVTSAFSSTSLSVSDKIPALSFDFGISPSFTPTKNMTFTSSRRVLSISPIRTQSDDGGISPTFISAKPESTILLNSAIAMFSVPSSSTILSRKSPHTPS